MLIDRVAEMGQINAAKCAMPIAAIALTAIELGPRLIKQRPLAVMAISAVPVPVAVSIEFGLVLRARRTQLLQPAADQLHPGIHLVRFRVLHLEVAPISAADKGSHLLPFTLMFPVVLAMDEFFEPLRR